jgi:hypothetical protein
MRGGGEEIKIRRINGTKKALCLPSDKSTA